MAQAAAAYIGTSAAVQLGVGCLLSNKPAGLHRAAEYLFEGLQSSALELDRLTQAVSHDWQQRLDVEAPETVKKLDELCLKLGILQAGLSTTDNHKLCQAQAVLHLLVASIASEDPSHVQLWSLLKELSGRSFTNLVTYFRARYQYVNKDTKLAVVSVHHGRFMGMNDTVRLAALVEWGAETRWQDIQKAGIIITAAAAAKADPAKEAAAEVAAAKADAAEADAADLTKQTQLFHGDKVVLQLYGNRYLISSLNIRPPLFETRPRISGPCRQQPGNAVWEIRRRQQGLPDSMFDELKALPIACGEPVSFWAKGVSSVRLRRHTTELCPLRCYQQWGRGTHHYGLTYEGVDAEESSMILLSDKTTSAWRLGRPAAHI